MVIQDAEAAEASSAIGTLVGIFVAPGAGAPMEERPEVRAVVERGLEGDRYFAGAGTYSATPGSGRDVTMVEADAIERLATSVGVTILPGDARRNLVVRGFRPTDLIGKRFQIGDVLFEGMRDCTPCAHLTQLAEPGRRSSMLKALVRDGGLRAEIRSSGTIHSGDAIRLSS